LKSQLKEGSHLNLIADLKEMSISELDRGVRETEVRLAQDVANQNKKVDICRSEIKETHVALEGMKEVRLNAAAILDDVIAVNI
jgi:hypothetical protein